MQSILRRIEGQSIDCQQPEVLGRSRFNRLRASRGDMGSHSSTDKLEASGSPMATPS